MTVKVTTRDSFIVEAAPIVRRFMGQTISDLTKWMGGMGGLRGLSVAKLRETDDA
jgi:hypothetical protein